MNRRTIGRIAVGDATDYRRGGVDPKSSHCEGAGRNSIARHVDQVRTVRIDRDCKIDRRLTAIVEGGCRKLGPGRARISRPKKPGHRARCQIDDPGGDRTARSSCNLYDRLIGGLDRSPTLRGSEHLGPSRTSVIAHENPGSGVASSIGCSYCSIKPSWIIGVAHDRTDWPIGKAGAAQSRYLSEGCAAVRAAKQSTGILISSQSGNFEGPRHHHTAAGANPNHALICERRRAQRSPRVTCILRVQNSVLQAAGTGKEAWSSRANRAIGGEPRPRDQSFAGWVGRIERETCDGERRLLVGERGPGCSAVGRLPDAAGGRANIKRVDI